MYSDYGSLLPIRVSFSHASPLLQNLSIMSQYRHNHQHLASAWHPLLLIIGLATSPLAHGSIPERQKVGEAMMY